MRLKILSVGRERADSLSPIVDDYIVRISKFTAVEDVVLKSEREDRVTAKLLRHAEQSRHVIALDERGKQRDSIAFARHLDELMTRGVSSACFIIGPADGMPKEVRERANELLGLSAMTLPHRLARLVLVEQLYRAFCILRNVPYQK